MISENYQPMGAKLAPDFILTLGEKDITENIRDRLITLKMEDFSGFTADTLNLTLDDSDGQLRMPERGAVVELFLGWQGSALIGQGKFIVDTITHSGAPDTLQITARSADFRNSMTLLRNNSYHDKTVGHIVQQIADRNGFPAPSLVPEIAAIKVPHIDQTNESDLQFLTRLASLNGAQASIKYQRILFLTPGMGRTSSGDPIPMMTLTRGDGDRHSFQLADAKAYTGVSAVWLNTNKPEEAQRKVSLHRQETAAKDRTLKHPAAKPGPAVAQKEDPNNYMVGQPDKVYNIPKTFRDKMSAMRAADALFKRIQKGVAKLSINLAKGHPELFPERPIRVRGFKSVIDNQNWVISKVTHNLSASGYTCALELDILLTDLEYQATES
ncbi:contractile injection system protein, VgrG/Pvc8 family [Serratia quinivorans]|uniref:contractile injection system protein, VgrG/Pvc8 family n=1 Tax=Serratia quinivorans TaxID=137545 RepID=UPI003F9D9D12